MPRQKRQKTHLYKARESISKCSEGPTTLQETHQVASSLESDFQSSLTFGAEAEFEPTWITTEEKRGAIHELIAYFESLDCGKSKNVILLIYAVLK